MTPQLSRRLSSLNDTDYFFSKGIKYWQEFIKEAEKAETFNNLSTKYQSDVFAAEKELKNK